MRLSATLAHLCLFALSLSLLGCGSADTVAGTPAPSTAVPATNAGKTDGGKSEGTRGEGGKKPEEPPPDNPALPVQVDVAGPGKVSERLISTGRLESARVRALVLRSTGVVSRLNIFDGQSVEAGQELIVLDALPEDAKALADAEVANARAERELHRLKDLAAKNPNAVSGHEIDQAADRAADAVAALAEHQRKAADRTITAPVAGVVDGLNAVLGQRINSGTELCRLHDASTWRLWVELPEAALGRLRVGGEVTCTSAAGNNVATGKIVALPGVIAATTGTGKVQVGFDQIHPAWRPGSLLSAACLIDSVEAPISVPRLAVVYQRNRPMTWVLRPDADGTLRVARQWLELGTSDPDRVEVKSGLKAGDQVVVGGAGGLDDRMIVRIEAAPKPKTAPADGSGDAPHQRRGGGPGSGASGSGRGAH